MFCLFTYLIHDVVDGNLSHKAVDLVNDGYCHKVVLLDEHCNLVDRGVNVNAYHLLVHDVLHLRYRRACYHLGEREQSA